MWQQTFFDYMNNGGSSKKKEREWNAVLKHYNESFAPEGSIGDNPSEEKTCIKEEPYDGNEAEVIILEDSSAENSPDKKKRKNSKNYNEFGGSKSCEICGKTLSSIGSLYVHLKTHSRNKPYNCEDCGSTFTRKYYLEVHRRSHTGERPFKCSECDKSFTQKSSLNTHKRKHTGEKPFTCHLCEKSFTAQSYLSSHHSSHYQKDETGVIHCSDCDKHFTSRTQFSQHLRIHAGTLGFECELCLKRFSKESFLIRHKKSVHISPKKKNVENTDDSEQMVESEASV